MSSPPKFDDDSVRAELPTLGFSLKLAVLLIKAVLTIVTG
jgi:hypothetical protein